MQVWEEHDILFHYTTAAGLTRILESRSLHATHYKYLNDTSEVVHLAPQLKKITKPGVVAAIKDAADKNSRVAEYVANHGGLDSVVEEQVGKMIDTLYTVTFGINRKNIFLEFYFVCFCHHGAGSYERDNGLLSQWRAYGRDAGYAIVFNVKKLTDLFEKEGKLHYYGYGGFGDIVYEGDSAAFNKEFEELIRLVGEQFPQLA